jgi:hypothetical protein
MVTFPGGTEPLQILAPGDDVSLCLAGLCWGEASPPLDFTAKEQLAWLKRYKVPSSSGPFNKDDIDDLGSDRN